MHDGRGDKRSLRKLLHAEGRVHRKLAVSLSRPLSTINSCPVQGVTQEACLVERLAQMGALLPTDPHHQPHRSWLLLSDGRKCHDQRTIFSQWV